MEVTMAQAAASPVEVQVNGVGVMVHPLTFRDWGSIEQWMKQEMVGAAKSVLRDPELNDKEKKLMIKAVTSQASKLSMNSPDGREGVLQSFGGMFRMAFYSLKRGNPALTLEKLDDIFGLDTAGLGDVVAKIFELTFPSYNEEKAKVTAEVEAEAKKNNQNNLTQE